MSTIDDRPQSDGSILGKVDYEMAAVLFIKYASNALFGTIDPTWAKEALQLWDKVFGKLGLDGVKAYIPWNLIYEHLNSASLLRNSIGSQGHTEGLEPGDILLTKYGDQGPKDTLGWVINNATGSYGYTHAAIVVKNEDTNELGVVEMMWQQGNPQGIQYRRISELDRRYLTAFRPTATKQKRTGAATWAWNLYKSETLVPFDLPEFYTMRYSDNGSYVCSELVVEAYKRQKFPLSERSYHPVYIDYVYIDQYSHIGDAALTISPNDLCRPGLSKVRQINW